MEATFPELVRRHAAESPHAVAIRERHRGLWRDTTWADVVSGLDAYTEALRRRGVAAGTAVAIVGRPSRHWLYAELAILRLGGSSYVVADRPLRSALDRLVAVPDLSLVVVAHADRRRSQALVDEIRQSPVGRARVPVESAHRLADTVLPAATATDSPGRLFLPSAGSSGDVRWVEVDGSTLIDRWAGLLGRFDVGPSDRVLGGGSLDFWVNRCALLTTWSIRRSVLHFNDDGVADQATRVQARPTVIWFHRARVGRPG